jgi:hypothetical protein
MITGERVKNQKMVEEIIRELHNEHNRKSHQEDCMSFLDFLDEISGGVVAGKYRVDVEPCDISFDGRKHVYYHI